MDEREKKLAVLAKIARLFNSRGVSWALGGSAMLYFRGRTDFFRDLDIMAAEKEIPGLDALVSTLCPMPPQKPADGRFRSAYFRELQIDGVEVDIIAGMVIVSKGREHRCPLLPEGIDAEVTVLGEKIPLQALGDWQEYYELMGRPEKAALAAP